MQVQMKANMAAQLKSMHTDLMPDSEICLKYRTVIPFSKLTNKSKHA